MTSCKIAKKKTKEIIEEFQKLIQEEERFRILENVKMIIWPDKVIAE